MRGFGFFVVAVWVALTTLVSADTIYLKNGKSIEGEVLTRETDRVWLSTDAGRVPLPLVRIAESSPEMLDEAREAFAGGDHPEALRLAEIFLFWNPGDEEAEALIHRAANQIELAAMGRELSELDQQAQDLLGELMARMEELQSSGNDPGAREEALLAIQSESTMAAQDFAETPSAKEFQALADEAAGRAVEAHSEKLERESREQEARELERTRMRAEALGIPDFYAPVATLNKGGRMVDIEQLKVPDGIMIFSFYAEGHAKSRALDPGLRDIAQDQENVYLRRINTLDLESPLARQYQLEGIPSVWIYDARGTLIDSQLSDLDKIREAVRKAGGR